jgi:putative ABC transport system ATP-binding protein
MVDEVAVVEAVEITKRYGRGSAAVTALDRVSIAFARARFTAVMGPSGSGKSTLLHCLAGLDTVDSGRVLLAGTDLGRLTENGLTRLRRDRIGFVFQAFNLLPALTAAQNVALPLRLAGRRPSARDIGEALATVGLADRARHRPGQLSGGQQQRVAIARALVTQPQVLFADEPTGALDTLTGRAVLQLLRSIVDDHAQTVVMVTHDALAASHADHVTFLADGQVVGQLDAPTTRTVTAWLTHLEG